MRVLLTAVLVFAAGCATPQEAPSAEADGNDCAVIAALAKEHYKFGPDNPPLPLKAGADDWAPKCDWAKHGIAFTAYDPDKPGDPRERLRYVDFQKPVYDGTGATVNTSIMHGPLAGMGYTCQMRSGFAGWTVENCKTAWVS